MFLAGDIGGTKTHLALYEDDGTPIRDQKFPSKDYKALSDIITEFGGEAASKACFGIAGPIEQGKCIATNLAWVVDPKDLPIPKSFLINDLEANAWGLRMLKEEEFYTLSPGDGNNTGNQALVSAGTGLGEAGLFFNGEDHIPFACEGGHCDFAPRNEREIDLLKFLMDEFGHASYERILSGPGLYNLYRFVSKGADEGITEPKQVTERALDGSSENCVETLKLFVEIYGAEAGNTALKMMALGGVYIGGGIAPKILKFIKEDHFMEAFMAKGRFEDLLSHVSVKIVLNEKTALLGATYYAQNLL